MFSMILDSIALSAIWSSIHDSQIGTGKNAGSLAPSAIRAIGTMPIGRSPSDTTFCPTTTTSRPRGRKRGFGSRNTV